MIEELLMVGFFFLAWGGFMIVLIYLSKLFHRHKWNEGFHRGCNGKWVYDFTDSQGNHCYHCELCKKPTDFGWVFN